MLPDRGPLSACGFFRAVASDFATAGTWAEAMTLDRTERLEQLLGHADWITRLSRALAGSGADADDVAQEAWVEVLRAPLGSVADPRRWLRAIMQRRAVKLRRSEER